MVRGYAPVPIVACVAGVIEGEDPTLACSYQTPFGISDFSTGQSFGQVSRTLRPPASHTMVTISFGGVSGAAARTSGRAEPSGASNPSNCRSPAVVGAMPAIVTGRCTAGCGFR